MSACARWKCGGRPWTNDDMPQTQRLRIWVATAVACTVISLVYGGYSLRQITVTQTQIHRLVLLGPNGQPDTIMHQVVITRRDGKAIDVSVSGTASPEQLAQLIAAFTAGDITPVGWKVTEWTIAGGATIKVSTPPQPGETVEQTCVRHDAFVADFQTRFPPVG